MNAIISRLVVVAALVVLPMPALAKGPRPDGPGNRPGIQLQVGKPSLNPAAKPGKPKACQKPQCKPRPIVKKGKKKVRRLGLGCARCR